MKNENMGKYIRYFIYAIIVTLTYRLVENYSYFFKFINKAITVIMPFIYGLAFAYILNPIVKLLNKRMKRVSYSSYIYFIGICIYNWNNVYYTSYYRQY